MNRDKIYLSLQFQNRIHKSHGTAFQNFFEEVMNLVYSGFRSVPSGGGDGGNDGWIKETGCYYQVYAPNSPKDSDAASKLQNDFKKILKNWNNVSPIKEFCFVYNDKYQGANKPEIALSSLEREYPEVKFKLFLSKDFEEVFFRLKEDSFARLGFDIDTRKTINFVNNLLSEVELYIDRESTDYAQKYLDVLKCHISSLNDESITLNYEICLARTLLKNEFVSKSIEIYESICKRYPQDPRAFLYLSEIYLNEDNLDENEKLLKIAEKIDPDFWLLKFLNFSRALRVGTPVDLNDIDESTFPSDARPRSCYYRIYSILLSNAGETSRALSFIERAISLNPDRLLNFRVKLSVLLRQAQLESDKDKSCDLFQGVLDELFVIESTISIWGELNPRTHVILNNIKLQILLILDKPQLIGSFAKDTFDLILKCHFNVEIDEALCSFIYPTCIALDDFRLLLNYLLKTKRQISSDLAKGLILQFVLHKSLFNDGIAFFKEIKLDLFVSLIENIKKENDDEVITFIGDDVRFKSVLINDMKDFPKLREKLVKSLPDDESVNKDILEMLVYSEADEPDKAYDILKRISIPGLRYYEAKLILDIVKKNSAWDVVIDIIKELEKRGLGEDEAIGLKLELLQAYIKLESHKNVIEVGNSILKQENELCRLNDENKELLLRYVLTAMLIRFENSIALELLERHYSLVKSSDFILSVVVAIYLKNGNPQKAISSIVDGVIKLKIPAPEDYGGLFYHFVEIANMIDFKSISLEKVVNNCFVKLKDQERWYFVGNEEALDATRIAPGTNRFKEFIEKSPGEELECSVKYRSEQPKDMIENILPIEKYILVQSHYHARELSLNRRWDHMELIEGPTAENNFNTQYITARFADNEKSESQFYDIYCNNNIPLAILATRLGGIHMAAGYIAENTKGFINSATGVTQELEQQWQVAVRIINGERFYIDGTAAYTLANLGILKEIYTHLSGIEIPQSVISIFWKLRERSDYTSGRIGYMRVHNGQVSVSNVDKNKEKKTCEYLESCIRLFEEKSEKIHVLSTTNKEESFCEKEILAESSDACILAQRDNTLILTDDFLYLKWNEVETKKTAPAYCSTGVLLMVLYKKKILSFEKYLSCFSFLAYNRYKFLPLHSEDIEKAVLGDGIIKEIKPENIRRFNMPVTLSEEYGVTPGCAFSVIQPLIEKILLDDAIIPETAERIFFELLTEFPYKGSKKMLGYIFLRKCHEDIKNRRSILITGVRYKEKADTISRGINLYTNDKAILSL